MKHVEAIPNKIHSLQSLLKLVAAWRVTNKTIAFTNGCFDILHEGHVYSLCQAAKEADYLIVALNTDESVKSLKGPSRPINKQDSRALVMASLMMVDAVILFNEATPLSLITAIKPDVIVKGGDYRMEDIVGAREVMAYGGKVVINPMVEGFSTTKMIEKIKG